MSTTTDDVPQGRAQWMRTVLERYERPLVHYATRLMSGDTERAREVVQETFLRLWKADTDAIEGHLAQWLYTVCRNRAIDVHRREEKMHPLPPDHAEAQPSPAPTPSDQVERRQSLSRALAALEQLPKKQQEVIRLKFQGGLSYKEISAVTGHSVSYVGVLIHTGMKDLRHRLAEDTRRIMS
ncbi:MAG: sigma-70 family RNA polymerase sigma factor [Myxococcota bacterium]